MSRHEAANERPTVAKLRTWLAAPLPSDVAQSIERLRQADTMFNTWQ